MRIGFAGRLAHRPTLAAQKGHALYPIRFTGAMRGTLFWSVGCRRMHLTTGWAAARPLRDLLATARPSVNMPAFAVPTFAGPCLALLAGAMPSVGTPVVGTPSFTVSSLPMPGTLRTLAGAAGTALPLL